MIKARALPVDANPLRLCLSTLRPCGSRLLLVLGVGVRDPVRSDRGREATAVPCVLETNSRRHLSPRWMEVRSASG